MFKATNIAPVSNYDDKRKKPAVEHRNPAIPNGVYNWILCGPTGCGKTNFFMNLLFDYLKFDYIYIYASSAADQDVYIEVMRKLDDIANEYDKDPAEIYFFSNNLSDVKPIAALDKTKINLVVFDDFVVAKNQSVIEEYFVRGRHKNCISMYLSQT